jgi:hypothetical protein
MATSWQSTRPRPTSNLYEVTAHRDTILTTYISALSEEEALQKALANDFWHNEAPSEPTIDTVTLLPPLED